MTNLLVNDPEFIQWNDTLDQSDLEYQMAEDGFIVQQFDEYEDGYYERSGRGIR